MSQETTNSSIGDDEDRRLDAKDADVELLEPEDMTEYNHVIPNGADRIMAMAEKEQDGRLSQAAKK